MALLHIDQIIVDATPELFKIEVKPKSVIRFHFVSFLSPLYCDHFGDGIAGYGETEREARQRRERRNGGKDRIIITEHYRISV